MANQGQQQSQRASASIGQQESANQMASAQQAARIQEMQAKGASDVDVAKATGAQAADKMGMQAELAKAGGMQAADIAMGQGAMEAQKYQLQGLADARDLTLQQKQGELSFLAGQLEAQNANQAAENAGK